MVTSQVATMYLHTIGEINQFLTIPWCSKTFETVFICLCLHYLPAMSWTAPNWPWVIVVFVVVVVVVVVAAVVAAAVVVAVGAGVRQRQAQFFQTISYLPTRGHLQIWDSETSSPVACDLGSWLVNDWNLILCGKKIWGVPSLKLT